MLRCTKTEGNQLQYSNACLTFSFKVMRFQQNFVKHDRIEEVICPQETALLQYVGDNTDHNLATLDGKSTSHVLGSIAIAIGEFSHRKIGRTAVPRDKKENNIGLIYNSTKASQLNHIIHLINLHLSKLS